MSGLLVVFAYDFPHQKTFEGLSWLVSSGIKVDLVIAAPRVKLNIRESEIRIAPSGLSFPHPRDFCATHEIPYWTMPHKECAPALRELRPTLGVILGARILPADVISCFEVGIINAHPGLIPENRGLDNVKWAIMDGIPQGVTTHLISPDIDLGRLIERREVPVLPDDTLIDIHVRLLNTEYQMIVDAVRAIDSGGRTFLAFDGAGVYRSTVPPDVEAGLLDAFNLYKARSHG